MAEIKMAAAEFAAKYKNVSKEVPRSFFAKAKRALKFVKKHKNDGGAEYEFYVAARDELHCVMAEKCLSCASGAP
ncbi:MAG: hypothetical protein KBS59_06630 [Clostridiales bacterium]|nr:hypothetical protein [Clostridiales bacterium]